MTRSYFHPLSAWLILYRQGGEAEALEAGQGLCRPPPSSQSQTSLEQGPFKELLPLPQWRWIAPHLNSDQDLVWVSKQTNNPAPGSCLINRMTLNEAPIPPGLASSLAEQDYPARSHRRWPWEPSEAVGESALTANWCMTTEYGDCCPWEGRGGGKDGLAWAWWSLTHRPKHSPSHSQKSESCHVYQLSSTERGGECWPRCPFLVSLNSTEHLRRPSTHMGAYHWLGRNREKIPGHSACATARRQGVGTGAVQGAWLASPALQVRSWDVETSEFINGLAGTQLDVYECIHICTSVLVWMYISKLLYPKGRHQSDKISTWNPM